MRDSLYSAGFTMSPVPVPYVRRPEIQIGFLRPLSVPSLDDGERRAARGRDEASTRRSIIPDPSTRFYAAGVHTESVAEFTGRMESLEALACPAEDDVAFFNDHTEIANQHGMSYREGLEFIIRMRHGGAPWPWTLRPAPCRIACSLYRACPSWLSSRLRRPVGTKSPTTTWLRFGLWFLDLSSSGEKSSSLMDVGKATARELRCHVSQRQGAAQHKWATTFAGSSRGKRSTQKLSERELRTQAPVHKRG